MQGLFLDIGHRRGYTVPMTVGERLRELRDKQGMSRRAVARELDVTIETIARWEKGGTSPPVARVRQICAFLGLSVVEFFEGVTEAESASGVE